MIYALCIERPVAAEPKVAGHQRSDTEGVMGALYKRWFALCVIYDVRCGVSCTYAVCELWCEL